MRNPISLPGLKRLVEMALKQEARTVDRPGRVTPPPVIPHVPEGQRLLAALDTIQVSHAAAYRLRAVHGTR